MSARGTTVAGPLIACRCSMLVSHVDDEALPIRARRAYTARPSSRPPGSPLPATDQPLAIDVRGIRRVYKVKPRPVVALFNQFAKSSGVIH